MTEIMHILEADQARILTDRIRTGIGVVWELVVQAYDKGAWISLGYDSWDEYCTGEFGTSRLIVPREERREVVCSLREAGLSGRAIGAAIGISEGTVRNDLAGAQDYAPPPVIIGTDGKTYTPPEPPPPPKPRWTAVERDIQRQIRAGETVVVTLRGPHDNVITWAQEEGLYIRVDRNSIWGNPFIMDKDGDRDTVITNYGKYYLPHKPSLMSQISSLLGMALGCWCAPEPCHADILKKLAER